MNLPLHKTLLFLHDIIVILFAEALSLLIYHLYYDDFKSDNGLVVGAVIILLSLLWFIAENNLYKYQVVLNRPTQVTNILKALFFSLVSVIFLSFVFKILEITTSRILIGMVYTTIFAIFLITRITLAPIIYFWMVKTKRINRNMLIVGVGKESMQRAKYLSTIKNSNFSLVGFVDDGEEEYYEDENNMLGKLPVLGNLDDLKHIVSRLQICDILVTANYQSVERLHDIINRCKSTNRTIHIASDFYNIVNEKIEIEQIGMVSSFRFHPPRKLYFYHMFKRFFDLVVASIIIIAFMPVWIFIATLIKLSSPGPIFYKATSVGLNGEEFKMYKFRSMRTSSSNQIHQDKVIKMILENEATTKLKNDPRITTIGKVLRKLSIDEFPQLINVLKGEMSLVGPRPNLPYEYKHMADWQKKRFSVIPGMTGLWQIKGRDEVLFNDQIVLDLYYIEHRSIKLDFEILLNTIPVVIFGKGGG
ncbi:sugar transferase [Fulvivirgaceae bacterium BMA12]|uniref:Sugar transferase n=1 Tax=Agaribacillus aureus TaxID=3051825 RepID=A0ABT8L916_9BACT|nr:sugar transferase [Fulvivirgaceae bacterium BMA12]